MILLSYFSRHGKIGKSGRNCWTWHVCFKETPRFSCI